MSESTYRLFELASELDQDFEKVTQAAREVGLSELTHRFQTVSTTEASLIKEALQANEATTKEKQWTPQLVPPPPDNAPFPRSQETPVSSAPIRRPLTTNMSLDVGFSLLGVLIGSLFTFFGIKWSATFAIWLSTHAIHGHPIITSLFLACFCLIPAPAALHPKMSVRSLAFGGLRGIGVGACALLILPAQGDLWNRNPDLALGLLALAFVGIVRPFGLLTVPIRGLLMLALGNSSKFAEKTQEHVCKNIEALVAEPTKETVDSPHDFMRTLGRLRSKFLIPTIFGPASVPSTVQSAFEYRTHLLTQLLVKPIEENGELKDAPRLAELTVASFDAELRLIQLQKPYETDPTAEHLIDRAAEIILLLSQGQPESTPFSDSETLYRLHKILENNANVSKKGLRTLRAVLEARNPSQPKGLVPILFLKDLPADGEASHLLYGLSRAIFALKLAKWQLLGWSEGLANLGCRELEKHIGASSSVHVLLTNVAARAIAPQAELFQSAEADPESRRMRQRGSEFAVASNDNSLLERIKGSTTPVADRLQPRTVLQGLRAFAIGKAFGNLPRPLGGTDGPFPLVSPIALILVPILFAFLFVIARSTTIGFATFATLVPPITDPFRSEDVSLNNRDIYTATSSPQTGEIFLGTDLGLHRFVPSIFGHFTEKAGPGGPQAAILDLVPTVEGLLLATVGTTSRGLDAETVGTTSLGLDLRRVDGTWKTLIARRESIPSPSNEIVDMLRTSPSAVMFITNQGLLEYDESKRRLAAISTTHWPQSPIVAVAFLDDSLFLATESGLFMGRKVDGGFEFSPVPQTILPGQPVELAQRDGAVLVRTDKNALLEFQPAANEWKPLAGGEQFDPIREQDIRHAILNPDNDALLIVIREDEGDRVAIRSPGARFWASYLIPEFRTSDLPPLLAPSGDIAFVGGEDGRIVAFRSNGGVHLDPKPLLGQSRVASMMGDAEGFLFVTERSDSQEIVLGTWPEASDPISLQTPRTIRPLGLQGKIIAIGASQPGSVFFFDESSQMIEYDLLQRTPVGERYQLLTPDGKQPIEPPLSVTVAKQSVLLTTNAGEVLRYPLPSTNENELVDARANGFDLRPLEVLLAPGSRTFDTQIDAAWDSTRGFEIIDSEGDGWFNDLAKGWVKIPSGDTPLQGKTATRLSDGTIMALDSQGKARVRTDDSWEPASPWGFKRVIPSRSGFACLGDDDAVVRFTISPKDNRPLPEVLRTAPAQNQATLALPLRDAIGFNRDGNPIIIAADSKGLVIYDVSQRAWFPLNVAIGFTRLEESQGVLYAEDDRNRIWSLNLETPELREIVDWDQVELRGIVGWDQVKTWTTTGDGHFVAVMRGGEVVRCNSHGVSSTILRGRDIESNSGTSVTCLGNNIVVLDNGVIYEASAKGEVKEIDLDDRMDNPTELASTGEVLVVRDAKNNVWTKTANLQWRKHPTQCKRLVELDRDVLIVDLNLGCSLVKAANHIQELLPGARSDRAGPISETSKILFSDDGLWMTSESSIIRWEPRGRGGRLDDFEGTLRLDHKGDQSYAFSDKGLWQLGARGPNGKPTVERLLKGQVSSILVGGPNPIVFNGTSTIRLADAKAGTWDSLAFRESQLLDSELTDAIQGRDNDTVVLLGTSGTLMEYDSIRRELKIKSEGDDDFESGMLHSLTNGYLIAGKTARDTTLIAVNGTNRKRLTNVTSFDSVGDSVLALQNTGKISRLTRQHKWEVVTEASPLTSTTIRESVPIDGTRMLLLDSDRRLFVHNTKLATTQLLLKEVHGGLHPVEGAPPYVLVEYYARNNKTLSVARIEAGRRPKTWPNARIVASVAGPHVFLDLEHKLITPRGQVIWDATEFAWGGGKPVALANSFDGTVTYVLDDKGDLWSMALESRRIKRVAEDVTVHDANDAILGTRKDGTPAIIESDRVYFPSTGNTRLVGSDAAVARASGGVVWIDQQSGRIVVDGVTRPDADKEVGDDEASTIRINPRIARAIIGSTLVYCADPSHGVVVDSKGILKPTGGIDLSKINRVATVRVPNKPELILLNDSHGKWMRVTTAEGLKEIPSPPHGFSRITIVDDGFLVALAKDNASYATFDLRSPATRKWLITNVITNVHVGPPGKSSKVWHIPGNQTDAIATLVNGGIVQRNAKLQWSPIRGIDARGATVSIYVSREKQKQEQDQPVVIRLKRNDAVEFHRVVAGALIYSLLSNPYSLLSSPEGMFLHERRTETRQQVNGVELANRGVRFTAGKQRTEADGLAEFLFGLNNYIACEESRFGANGILDVNDELRFSTLNRRLQVELNRVSLGDVDISSGKVTNAAERPMPSLVKTRLAVELTTDNLWCQIPHPLSPLFSPIRFRVADGRLKSYCPTQLKIDSQSRVVAEYPDGQPIRLALPVTPRSTKPSFRFKNGQIELQTGSTWKRFLNDAEPPIPLVDLPKNGHESIAVDKQGRVVLIDHLGRAWIHSKNDDRTLLASGRSFSSARLRLVTDQRGNPAIGLKNSSDTWIYDNFGMELKRAAWGVPPPRIPSNFACNEIRALNQGGVASFTTLFSNRTFQLAFHGEKFTHQIPVGITRNANGWLASVRLESTTLARAFDENVGSVHGPLVLPPVVRRKPPPPIINTAIGPSELRASKLHFTVETVDNNVVVPWDPAKERFDLDQPSTMAQVDEILAWTTPDGHVVVAPTDLQRTTLVWVGLQDSAVEVREGGDAFQVKLKSGHVISIDGRNLNQQYVGLEDSVFAPDQERWLERGDNHLDLAPEGQPADFRIMLGGEKRSTTWESEHGCFGFERLASVPIPVPRDKSIAQSARNGDVQLRTPSGDFCLGQAGRFVGMIQDADLVYPSTIRTTDNQRLTVNVDSFRGNPGQAVLTLNEGNNFLEDLPPTKGVDIPWAVKRGLLPHSQINVLARPPSMSAGSFLAFAGTSVVSFDGKGAASSPLHFPTKPNASPTVAGLERKSGEVLAKIGGYSLVFADGKWRAADPERWASRWDARYQDFSKPILHSEFVIRRDISKESTKQTSVDFGMSSVDGELVSLEITPKGFDVDNCFDLAVADSSLLLHTGGRVLRSPKNMSCVYATIGPEVDPKGEWTQFATSSHNRDLGRRSDQSLFAIDEQTLALSTATQDPYRFALLERYDETGKLSPARFEFKPVQAAEPQQQLVLWHRGNLLTDDLELHETRGRFSHDSIHGAAQFSSGDGEPNRLVGSADDSLWIRDAATKTLLDVRYFENAPQSLLTTLHTKGIWVRDAQGWHQVLLNAETDRLLEPTSPLSRIPIELETCDWSVEWEDEPVFLDRSNNPVSHDQDAGWLPGDRVFAAAKCNNGVVIGSNMSVRFNEPFAPPRAVLRGPFQSTRIRHRPSGVFMYAEGGNATAAVQTTLTGPKVTAYVDEPAQWIGPKLELSESPGGIPTFRSTIVDSNSLSLQRVKATLASGCFESDAVISIGMRRDVPLALSALGFLSDAGRGDDVISIENVISGERFISPGILELGSQSDVPIVSTNHGLRKLFVVDNEPQIYNAFESPGKLTRTIFDDEQWHLNLELSKNERTLRVVRHDLTIPISGVIRDGQFSFDEIVATGVNSSGAWLRTLVTHERFENDELETIDSWESPSESPALPLPRLDAAHIRAFDPRTTPNGDLEKAVLQFLGAPAAQVAGGLPGGSNAFLLGSGCWVIEFGTTPTLRWFRPHEKWRR